MTEKELGAFLLGQFIQGWSMVEGTLEVAVGQLLKLDPIEGSIVTAGLQMRAKTVLLQALLNRDATANDAALKVVRGIQNFSDRNDMLHGIYRKTNHGIMFTRRRNDGYFRSETKTYSNADLFDVCIKVADVATDLWRVLGITERSYSDYLNDAHNAQIKPSTSPSAPSTKGPRLSKSQSKTTMRAAAKSKGAP